MKLSNESGSISAAAIDLGKVTGVIIGDILESYRFNKDFAGRTCGNVRHA